MEYHYSVFGLSLRSNLSLPGLQTLETPSVRPDVEICLGTGPDLEHESAVDQEILTFTSSDLGDDGQPALRIWRSKDGSLTHLSYYDGVQFWTDPQGKKIWAKWPAHSSLEDAASYLLGPVLGLLLRTRGINCLHASAVSMGSWAVAFAGSEGAGKSTTAAAFARRGCGVLSDDIVALVQHQGGFCVIPAYPYLSLWQDSVELLYGPDKAVPQFSSNWDKRLLSLAGNSLRFEEQPLPLRAIYILGERSSAPEAPRLSELTPQEALISLVVNSYATSLLDTEMRAREFDLLGRLVAKVPVRRLQPHTDPARIEHLCDLVFQAHVEV